MRRTSKDLNKLFKGFKIRVVKKTKSIPRAYSYFSQNNSLVSLNDSIVSPKLKKKNKDEILLKPKSEIKKNKKVRRSRVTIHKYITRPILQKTESLQSIEFSTDEDEEKEEVHLIEKKLSLKVKPLEEIIKKHLQKMLTNKTKKSETDKITEKEVLNKIDFTIK